MYVGSPDVMLFEAFIPSILSSASDYDISSILDASLSKASSVSNFFAMLLMNLTLVDLLLLLAFILRETFKKDSGLKFFFASMI